MYFDRFPKNIQVLNFMKVLSVGAESFHADGWTDGQRDTTKLTVTSRNFANMPIKIKYRQRKFVTMHVWELSACGIWLRNLNERGNFKTEA